MKGRKVRRIAVTAIVLLSSLVIRSTRASDKVEAPEDWATYGGNSSGNHYSPLNKVNRENVQHLREVWRVDVGKGGGLQTNPLVVGRRMFVYTPSEDILALDAATGKQLWRFSAGVPAPQPNRGFSYWRDGRESILFAGIMDHLYALDPATGHPLKAFGEDGKIDLRKDLGDQDYTQNFAVLTTPGTIYKDMIIVGFRAPETQPAPHGDIRAYDVHTGKLRWSFHTIPHPGDPGYESWPKDAWRVTGSANNWSGMVVDLQRGILFAPTGSAVNDFYGADRVGDDLYSDTLLALDANTGKEIWHFQAVHHDIWDRDFPSPPVLVTVKRDGKPVDAVAQTTKQGFVFLFERTTGKPLFPIEEKSYPASDVPGEVTAPTQPLPVTPAPFARQRLTADMLTNRTPAAHTWAEEQFKTFRSEGQFVPFTVGRPTIIFPGYDGGAEWGGAAVEPTRAILYVNANDIPWTGELAPTQAAASEGATIYQSQCAVCHGHDRKGSPPEFPSLLEVKKRLSDAAISDIIHNGRGRMPSFPALQDGGLEAVLKYLGESPGMADLAKVDPQAPSSKTEVGSEASGSKQLPKYQFTGYKKFYDPDGYPAVVPPWGTLNAIDLNTGSYRWKVPLGNYPELAAAGMKATGSENYGGPVITGGGLLFIAATIYDRKIRAFNSDTGELLWEGSLPFAGTATPATYMIDGNQYIVIATSGQRDKKGPQGAAYIVFALP
ncbi:PQQ-binding-like beta-propeller repeat protein [Acidisarcina polymorpha]|uniref:outer membrane protein assembly factor BamB family protein n=1 Tax=Acidisarcina polymorpha TaxID=2211140 RepID=UPI001F1F301F|nr:PQQ-binding-like beta-propeller repeat protein [Acidisarcina polymorpha]